MGTSNAADSPRKLPERIATAPPLVKIAVWVGATFVASLLVQLLLIWLGTQPRLFIQPPRGVAAIAALAGLAILAAADRRPMLDYGLAGTERWGRSLAGGFLVGFIVAAGWYLLCYLSHALGPHDPVRWNALYKFILVLIEALIAGFAIQIVFSGYLFSIIRERHSPALAVILPAIALPLMYRIDAPTCLVTHGEWRRSVGMFLMQLLAGMLRLRTGHIMLSTGLLAGIAVLRRMVRKTGVLQDVLDPELANWLCPAGDIHRAPAFWIMTAAAALILALFVRTRVVQASFGQSGIPASLKRVYPLAMPMNLAPLDLHLKCLRIARWHIGRDFIPRAIAALFLSTINTVLCLPERLLSPLLRRRRIPDPIFVVGVHRSGTTHLHNLLALDPKLITPRHGHVLNPSGALICGWPLVGFLAAFLPWRRPMDNMTLHVLSPGEEEFAVANLCHVSPYWGWVYPERAAVYDRYLYTDGFTPRERRIWQRAYRCFLGRLALLSHRRPVLKNPCNTGRVEMLLDMFPDARIVHIHRHPHDVYRSNMHFAREGHCIFRLQDPVEGDSYTDHFLRHYARMETECYRVAEQLPPHRFVDVCFEDLEKDALGEIERIYQQLDLEFSSRYRRKLERYLGSIAGYRKNRFKPVDETLQREIESHLGPLLHRWSYDSAVATPAAVSESELRT